MLVFRTPVPQSQPAPPPKAGGVVIGSSRLISCPRVGAASHTVPPPPLWPPPSASLACPLPLLVRLLPAPHGRSASWRGVHNRPESAADRRHAAWPGPPRRVRELAFAPPLLPTAARGSLRSDRRRTTCRDSTALALLLAGGGARGRISHVPLLSRAWTTQFERGRDRPLPGSPSLRGRPPTLRRNHACLDRTRLVL